jgi:hypothetical protein
LENLIHFPIPVLKYGNAKGGLSNNTHTRLHPKNVLISMKLNDYSINNTDDLLLTLNINPSSKRKSCTYNVLSSLEECFFAQGKILFGQIIRRDYSTYWKYNDINTLDNKIFIPFRNENKEKFNGTWEAIFDLNYLPNNYNPVEYEFINREENFYTTNISTNFKGGNININNNNKNKTNYLNMDLSIIGIQELDRNGILIGEGNNLNRHRITKFSTINFETDYAYNYNYANNYFGEEGYSSINTTKIGLRTDFNYYENKEQSHPRLYVNINSFKNKGIIPSKINKSYRIVNKEDVEFGFTLDLNKWDFCRQDKKNCLRKTNNTNDNKTFNLEDYDETKFIDVTFMLNNNEVPLYINNTNELNHIEYKNSKVFLSTYYLNFKMVQNFTNGYPKLTNNGTSIFCTLRFPLSGNNYIEYEGNIINITYPVEERSYLFIVLIIVVCILILFVGILTHLKRSKATTRISSTLIDSNRSKDLSSL